MSKIAPLKIGTLRIDSFRAIRHLKVENLGRVNLITGRNNTGKSSILEALRILAADASPTVLSRILRYREEDFDQFEDRDLPGDPEDIFQISSLFHGFPQLEDNPKPILIEATGGEKNLRLSLGVDWLSEEPGLVGRPDYFKQVGFFDDDAAVPSLVIESGGRRRPLLPWSLTSSRNYLVHRVRGGRPDPIDEAHLACVFASPYGEEKTGNLGGLWDRIALSDGEDSVVQALKIIDPRIMAVSMVGGEHGRQMRTAIVRAEGLPRPVPLRSFGDGLNRLFGIALSLVNARNGLLLVDEFENGLHHTVQFDTWRMIFRLAKDLNIQVFATSHSWDSIEAFQAAAAEDPAEGVLVRLTRTGEHIVPTVFREAELAVVTRDRIEVR